jgi:hypothetical protein
MNDVDYVTPQSLLDLDREIAARIAARLPEIVWGVIDRLDETPPGHKFGWRHWCEKHNWLLRDYTMAAIALHHATKRWRGDRGAFAPYSAVTNADAVREAARSLYHNATCTCFIDINEQQSREQRGQHDNGRHERRRHRWHPA